MDVLDDILVLHIASYCGVHDLVSLGLVCKRYGAKPADAEEVTMSYDGRRTTMKRSWSLMDEAARRILCKDVAEHDFIHLNLFYSFDCLIYYKKDVTYKMLKTIMQGMMGTEHCTAEMEEEISQNVLSKMRMRSGIIATKRHPSISMV